MDSQKTCQAYTFVELFAGAAWTSRMMRAGDHAVASFDITSTLLGPTPPNKQNPMDLSTSAGFASLGWQLINFLSQSMVWTQSWVDLHPLNLNI